MQLKIFLFHGINYLLACINHNLLIHSTAHRHLGSFHSGSVRKNQQQFESHISAKEHINDKSKCTEIRPKRKYVVVTIFTNTPILHISVDLFV